MCVYLIYVYNPLSVALTRVQQFEKQRQSVLDCSQKQQSLLYQQYEM